MKNFITLPALFISLTVIHSLSFSFSQKETTYKAIYCSYISVLLAQHGVAFSLISDAYHAIQVIIAGHRHKPSSRGHARSNNGRSMTTPMGENDGKQCRLSTHNDNAGLHKQPATSGHQTTGERVVCIPSSNQSMPCKRNHEISQAAIHKSEPNYGSGEFDLI